MTAPAWCEPNPFFNDDFAGPTLNPVWQSGYDWGDGQTSPMEPVSRPVPQNLRFVTESGRSCLAMDIKKNGSGGKPYTSAIVSTGTRLTISAGTYIECMFKNDDGEGLWGAFWLYPPAAAYPPGYYEIDIEETGGRGEYTDEWGTFSNYQENVSHGIYADDPQNPWTGGGFPADRTGLAYYWQDRCTYAERGMGYLYDTRIGFVMPNFTTGFHQIGLRWAENGDLTFMVDRQPTAHVPISRIPLLAKMPAMQVIMQWIPQSNTAMRIGKLAGEIELNTFVQQGGTCTKFVDYVTAWRLKPATPPPPPPPPPPPQAFDPNNPTGSGMTLKFADEFGALSASDSGVDGGQTWANHIWYYGNNYTAVNDPAGLSVVNGILQIKAWNPGSGWRSGCLQSTNSAGRGFAQKYGYFEVRARVPIGQGLLSTFFLMSNNRVTNGTAVQTEIDVLEHIGAQPTNIYTTLHRNSGGTAGGNPPDSQNGNNMVNTGINLGLNFHRYGVLWAPNSPDIVFYFDGVEVTRCPKYDTTDTAPMMMILQLGTGPSWFGPGPSGSTPNPAIFEVDWVRVYQFPGYT